MKINLHSVLAAAGLAASSAALAGGVTVSSFGYDPVDSTRFIEQALTSGARQVILDRQAGPWYTRPLKMRSNTELILEDGVELVAKRGEFKGLRDFLLELPGVENCAIRGGKGATLRMWKSDYQGPDYRHGEWRYGLRLHHATNVVVEGIRVTETGGDGLGVTGRNITIRNCVFDRNHRQGASVFNVDGLLMENCVFSNTEGTPPAAGIDFEPDRNGWKLSNIVMRNCLFENNHGNGIELHLTKLRADSAPVSFLFENCRTVGNRASVTVNPGNRGADHVRGTVRFVNCSFESATGRGIALANKTAGAFDVSFANCVVSNAASDSVSFATSSGEIIPPLDGIDFDNLTVYPQKADDAWFRLGRQGFGPVASNVTGSVTVIRPDGSRTVEALDAAWRARNLPPRNGGRIPPPHLPPRPFADLTAVDACPGELADLAPVSLLGKRRRYLFLVGTKGPVTFVARQSTPVKGRKLSQEPLVIQPVLADGTLGKKVVGRLPMPGATSETLVYKAKKPGLYALTVKPSKTRFTLEKSSVPVAMDVSQGEISLAAVGRRPFALSFLVRSGERFQLFPVGGSYSRFACTLKDPAGAVVATRPCVRDLQTIDSGADPAPGLWRVEIGKGTEPTYDTLDLDLTGLPSAFFLTGEKVWR